MKGTVIKVEENRSGKNGYFYFGPDYMEQFDGGEFLLSAGRELPNEIGLLPEGEREALRSELFPEEDEQDESQSE